MEIKVAQTDQRGKETDSASWHHGNQSGSDRPEGQGDRQRIMASWKSKWLRQTRGARRQTAHHGIMEIKVAQTDQRGKETENASWHHGNQSGSDRPEGQGD